MGLYFRGTILNSTRVTVEVGDSKEGRRSIFEEDKNYDLYAEI